MEVKMKIVNDIIEIETDSTIMHISLSELLVENEKRIKLNIPVKNKLIFVGNVNEFSVLSYTLNNELVIIKSITPQHILIKNYIHVRSKVLFVKLTKNNLFLISIIAIENPYNLEIKTPILRIGKMKIKELNIKKFTNVKSKFQMLKAIKFLKIETKNIEFSNHINNGIDIVLDYNQDNYIKTKISMKNKKISKTPKLYYVPSTCVYNKNSAIHVRRNYKGNLILVKRRKQAIENTMKFRLLNNRFVSFPMYWIGYIVSKVKRKPINIFYEKYASKAEEGAYDLFQLASLSKNSSNYYIIEEKSPDYEKIKSVKNVIKKNSLLSYILIYCSKTFIATEVPMHLNVLQSNNKYFRRACFNKKFVFLQHGITYLKSHGSNSTYCKNKEGEPNYIVTSGEKEMHVINKLMGLEFEQMLNVGLPAFSKLKNDVINESSLNHVVIMLTWKPYEENLELYEESDYYKNTLEILNVLLNYLPEKSISIIPHPKVFNRIKVTSLAKYIKDEPVSEQLKSAKLLITDYSSVCYNTFYQGGGVVFYQPDLEKYEKSNGKLIPTPDEYIGYRVFELNALSNLIKKGINQGHINLEFFRLEKFKNNYKLINEFSDGKNIERLYKKLAEKKII